MRYRTRFLAIAVSAALMVALPTAAFAHSGGDDDGDRTRTEERNETRNRERHECEGLVVLRCGGGPLISISL